MIPLKLTFTITNAQTKLQRSEREKERKNSNATHIGWAMPLQPAVALVIFWKKRTFENLIQNTLRKSKRIIINLFPNKINIVNEYKKI